MLRKTGGVLFSARGAEFWSSDRRVRSSPCELSSCFAGPETVLFVRLASSWKTSIPP
jgi:hypothetical protein